MNDAFGSIRINTIAGGVHDGGTQDEHYRGKAVDIRFIGGVVENTGVSRQTILDYLEQEWGFRTQRNTVAGDNPFAGENYLGAGHFHLSIFGRNF